MDPSLKQQARQLVEQSLREDLGGGDLTTQTLFPEAVPACAELIAREDLILAGMEIAGMVFNHLDPSLRIQTHVRDGARVQAETPLVRVEGDGRSILMGERVALNFLQRLSGIATLTHRFVTALQGYSAKIMDTRKTTPGWRDLEKYAVRQGGGQNHRFNLNTGILIKDNHLELAGGLGQAVEKTKREFSHPLRVEVETTHLAEVQKALSAGADIIMLDNMPVEEMKQAVKMIAGRAVVEASGGITLQNVVPIAATGVDWISVGALTHSAPAADISLTLRKISG